MNMDRKKSLRTKVVLTFLAEIFGCMTIVILSCNLLLRPVFINDSKKSMERYGAEVCTALEQGKEMDQIIGILDKVNTAYLIRTTILSEDFRLLFNEDGKSSGTLSKSMQRLIGWIQEYEKEDNAKTSYFKERYDDNYQIRRLFYIKKTKDHQYVIMDKAIKGIEQDTQLITIFITIMGITVALIGGISWSFLTRPFTSQMEKMSRITKQISELNFEEKINYYSEDEVGVLSESIDELSERLKNSIESLQKDIESRKLLIRNISHELKTPITTIRGYAENTQIVAADNEKIERYCDIMIEECDEIDRLVSEMLEMSRLEDSESYEKTLLKTETLFESIHQKMQIEFPKRDIIFDAESCELAGNEPLLQRAVQNYVRNAVKYGTPGGKIQVNGRKKKSAYVISVVNEGNVIPEEEQEAIWDVFYKGDKARKRDKSHGIGLSIVKQIACLHGGGVGVESKDGITAFWIWLPVH